MYTINKKGKEIPIEDIDIDDLIYLRDKYIKMISWNKNVDRYKQKWVTILKHEIKVRDRKDKIKKIVSNVNVNG